jgi:hypothetical protein
MNSDQRTSSSTTLARFWAVWIGVSVGGPLLTLSALMLHGPPGFVADLIWVGILTLTLAGIIWSSTRIAAAGDRYRFGLAIGLVIGGLCLSTAIFFGYVLANWAM